MSDNQLEICNFGITIYERPAPAGSLKQFEDNNG
jgi:hypothetical protein